MNIFSRFKNLIFAFSALALFLAASPLEAIIINYKTPPIGITDGKTMRVNLVNVGTSTMMLPAVQIFGEDGNLLAEFFPTETIAPAKGVSFDLPRDIIRDGGGRLELNVDIVVEDPDQKSLSMFLDSVRITVEILDAATGEIGTLVAIGNSDVFSAK